MKISDKLVKVDEDMSIRMFDNGFLFEIQGRDDDENWTSLKIVCHTLDEVTNLVKEATQMERS